MDMLEKELPWEERTEQWKTDGKCLECRRHGYCKTQCTKNRNAVRAYFMNALRRRMAEKTGIAPAEVAEGSVQ